jgi:glycosyltransferase involved in cell wall biosynthesis
MIKARIAILMSHPIQHFIPQFANYSLNKNFEIKVFFASKSGSESYYDSDFKREVKWNNLEIEKINHEFLNERKVLSINRKLDAPELEKKLKEYDPNFVLQYGYYQKMQRRAHKWAYKNNIPIIHFADSELRHYRKWYNKVFKKIYLHLYYKRISAFLTTGDANEAYYRYYGVKDYKFFKSPYPIDRDFYEHEKYKKTQYNLEIRNKHSISQNNLVLTVVGKLVDWKSQNHLIHALKKLDSQYNNLTILIIGSGEKEKSWKKEALEIKNNQVIFTGFINSNDLPKYYSATNIYVHPAYIEPHSVAISEAIYMGCPVIVSNKCGSYGSSDDVRQGSNGFVFRHGNIEDLVVKIKMLVDNPEMRKLFSIKSEEIGFESQKIAHFGAIEAVLRTFNIII